MDYANLYDTKAPKKSANLSINSDLLKKAKECRVNLSQALEIRLAEIIREENRKKWREETREAVAEYNLRVEKEGAFSDGLRVF